jgi:hypothetical protein
MGKKTPTQLGPLKRNPVAEISCFYSQEHRMMEKVQKLKNSSVGKEPPFIEDLSMETEEKPLLKPLSGNVQ